MEPASPDEASARDRGLDPRPPSFEGDDRFEIRSTLGRGTSSVVYRSLDHQRGAEVALKVLSVQGAAGMLAFKREFRSMADVAHPNLVKLYELHAAGDGLMFTMELVDGTDFLGYVRRPVGATPNWEAGRPRPSAPERDTIAEWAGPAPERVPMGLSGELAYFPPLTAGQMPGLRSITAQLVRGLMALHDAGHVHRDVKPSNVMVDDSGRVVLLDFGVVAELSGTATAAGTPAYMSPEQAQGERPSPSADFYAVGVMLYEALTGKLPHAGDDPVRDKLAHACEPPSTHVPAIPLDLDRLCLALLAREPALRPEGAAILDLLCGDSERTLPPRHRAETPLVGRDDELRRIERAMHEVTRGQGQLVLVTGRSGIGKSALIRHFLARQRRNGAVVLTGRCYEQESVPYKALDAVMDAVCQHLASLSPEDREEVMPRHRWALGRLFPVLAQFGAPTASMGPATVDTEGRMPDVVPQIRQHQTVPVTQPRNASQDTATQEPLQPEQGVISGELRPSIDASVAARSTVVVGAPSTESPLPSGITTDPARVRRQGVAALRQLLEALARHAPLIIAIDDLQWGDVDSGQVLAEVLAPPQPPLLLLGSYRQEDEHTSEFLRNFLPAQPSHDVIGLEGLDESAAMALAQTLVAGSPQLGAAEVVEEAKGDPFLLVELARYVSLHDDPQLPASGVTIDAVVRARIEHLEAPARRLLQAVSLAAGPLARAVARRAAGIGAEESTAMVQLRTANLLRVKGIRGVEVVDAYHDRIREAVVEQLGEQERRQWHMHLAEALLAEGYIDHGRIGKHLEAGGHRVEAMPHYLEAAEGASRTLAFDRAADLYRRALAVGALTADEEVRVRNEYADVLMRQGRFDEASSALKRAHESLRAGEDRARVLHKLGEVELARGDVAAAATALEHALADLGQPVPRGRYRLLLGNLREIGVQLRRTYFPSREPPLPALESERLAMRIYSRLTYAYYFSRDGLQVFWPHLRELNAAERHPPTPELGRAYAGHGMMLAVLPWFRRGLTYVERSLDIQKRLGDRWGEAQAHHHQGVVLYGASRFSEAERVSTMAAEQLEALGDAVEAHDALLHAAMAMHQQGRSAEATGIARRVHEEALDTGDMFAAATSILVWTHASGGRVPSMMIQVQVDIATQIDHRFIKVVAMHANGLRLLGVGRPGDAARALDAASDQLREFGLMSTELLADIDVWRATAWRRVALGATDAATRARALSRARSLAWRGLWAGARFRNALPHALREAGRLAAMAGQWRRARHLLDTSLSMALRHEQVPQAAMTRLLRDTLFGHRDAVVAAEARAVREKPSTYAIATRLEGDDGRLG